VCEKTQELDHQEALRHHVAMIILPGLTSTKKERIPAFLDDLRRSDVRLVALFPTMLGKVERLALYRELETIPGLKVPHVHLRSDCGVDEIEYLMTRLGAEVFNVHPRASTHPFGPLPALHAHRIFIENVEVPAEDAEFEGLDGLKPGGMCPDFSHLENARVHGKSSYVNTVMSQLQRVPMGCCHVSAIRTGVPNQWSGEWDHHEFATLDDLTYLEGYLEYLPETWVSLELENCLEQQLLAADWLENLQKRSPPSTSALSMSRL